QDEVNTAVVKDLCGQTVIRREHGELTPGCLVLSKVLNPKPLACGPCRKWLRRGCLRTWCCIHDICLPKGSNYLGSRQAVVTGTRRSRPKAIDVILVPNGYWRRFHSARSTSETTRSTTSLSKPRAS